LALGVTRPELEIDHSLLPSAEVKSGCTPHMPKWSADETLLLDEGANSVQTL